MKKVLILVGHPDSASFNVELADKYAEGAKESGHEVKRVNLGDLHFDPILHQGYKVIQELEPDLKQVQNDINWCDHFVIFYPSWWSTMPALLKGMFDRIWMPSFAFTFKKEGVGKGLLWKKLMKGKTARVFVTSDAHPFFARLIFGDTTNEIRKGILWFAGFSVSVKKIGPLKHISDKGKDKWKRKVKNWGKEVY